jgi:hypothetical protein
METEINEMIGEMFLKIKDKLPYLSFSECELKMTINSTVRGIRWANIKEKNNLNRIISIICGSILKQQRCIVEPEKMPENIKKDYLKCYNFAEDKFIQIEISFEYEFGFTAQTISKHIGLSKDKAIMELTKVYEKGKEDGLEIQLLFMSEEDKRKLFKVFFQRIRCSLKDIEVMISKELIKYDDEVKKEIKSIVTEYISLITNDKAKKYQLVG